MNTKLNLGGEVIEAEKMDFEPIEENWNLYRLDDGTIVKIKLIVSDIFKLASTDPLTGVHQFVAKSSNVMTIDQPTPKNEVH